MAYNSFCATASGYARTIKGIVYSKTDQLPIPGVSVKVLNTKIGTNTDFDGKFTIKPPINSCSSIYFLGYKSQQITVNDNKFLKIYLRKT